MRRGFIAAAAVLAISVFAAQAALASNVHFKGKSGPSFTDNGLTLTAAGTLTGLGSGDILVSLSATGNPTAVCTNPSGQNQPPGRNPASVTLTGSESIPQSQIKNGNADFDVTTNPPTSPVPGAPECPSKSWTETITDVAFTGATINVKQGGSPVLSATCTFSPATSDGAVPTSTQSC